MRYYTAFTVANGMRGTTILRTVNLDREVSLHMKMLKRILVVATIVLMIPASGFAIVDFGAYGGYYFAGELDLGDFSDRKPGTAGWEYGFLGHLNGGVPMLFSVGLGGFWQRSPLQYEAAGTSYDAKKTTYGLDIIAQLELPIIIHPYVRAGIAIKEKLEIEYEIAGSTYTKSNEEYFKSYYFGLGAGFTVFPMVQLFGEYLFTRSKQENGVELQGSAVHVGAKISI